MGPVGALTRGPSNDVHRARSGPEYMLHESQRSPLIKTGIWVFLCPGKVMGKTERLPAAVPAGVLGNLIPFGVS